MKLDHIGVAVKNLEESLRRWSKILKLTARGIEEIKERGVRVAHLDVAGGPSIELVTPFGAGSPVEKFLNERGEGIHHFCFEVNDIKKTMEEMKKQGIRLVQDRPHKGAGGSLIAFIHPRSFNGVLLELKEKKAHSL